jgi:hypothetical protein
MRGNKTQEANVERQCSFCGKGESQVNQLTVGPGEVAICDACVDLYREHLEKEAKNVPVEKIIQVCRVCGTRPPASHRYCYQCGAQLPQDETRDVAQM